MFKNLPSERTRNIDLVRPIYELACDVIDRHMAHKEGESYPWHQGSIHVCSNQICPSRAYEQCTNAGPKIEEPNKVEERNSGLGSELGSFQKDRSVYAIIKRFFW